MSREIKLTLCASYLLLMLAYPVIFPPHRGEGRLKDSVRIERAIGWIQYETESLCHNLLGAVNRIFGTEIPLKEDSNGK